MRMKFNKSSQLLLVGAASLLAASLVTACSQLTQTLTVDFVYVASAKAAGADNYGEINVFEVNSESGRMRQIPTSPFPSQGRNPVAEAVSVDYGSLFVVNRDDNTIVQFGIGTDGKLYTRNAGDRRVFWEGPSVGFDTGADGARTMMLVYNLPATEAIYQRFAGVDGSAYFIGGFGMTALTANKIVVVPIRSGVGLRLGANIGYLKFTPQATWNPF